MGLQITTTATLFKISTQEYASVFGYTEHTFQKYNVGLGLNYNIPVIDVLIGNTIQHSLSLDGNSNSLVVSTINGVAPADLTDLYNMLVAVL